MQTTENQLRRQCSEINEQIHPISAKLMGNYSYALSFVYRLED